MAPDDVSPGKFSIPEAWHLKVQGNISPHNISPPQGVTYHGVRQCLSPQCCHLRAWHYVSPCNSSPFEARCLMEHNLPLQPCHFTARCNLSPCNASCCELWCLTALHLPPMMMSPPIKILKHCCLPPWSLHPSSCVVISHCSLPLMLLVLLHCSAISGATLSQRHLLLPSPLCKHPESDSKKF